MSTENDQLAVQAPASIVPKEDGNIAVTALMPEHVADCQIALIAWAERKVNEVTSDSTELREAFEHAVKAKWKSGTLKRHWKAAEKREVFYRKILMALQAGYVIVPNFPVQMFAIRTDKAVKYMRTTSGWNTDFKQEAPALTAGEGEYQNPFPTHTSRTIKSPTESNPQRTETLYEASQWDEFEFPVSMAKPEIMEATSRAMALQFFDQLGILPQARKEDPMIIGQIIRKRPDGYSIQTVSFMVAWHLDTRVL